VTVSGATDANRAADRGRLLDPGSFRDRHGRVYRVDGRVLRGLSTEATEAYRVFEASGLLRSLTGSGKVVATWELVAGAVPKELQNEGWAMVLEHQPVPFVSYPYEWTFGMLKDAALLQLELLREALAHDLILKDATPYNIQFVGSEPVFIDLPSFVPYRRGETWIGYRQFCELFLNPLLLHAYRGLPFQQWLRGRLEGITPQACLDLMSRSDLLRGGVLAHVWLHAKAEGRLAPTRNVTAGVAAAGFDKALILNNVCKLEKLVRRLRPRQGRSVWVGYREDNSYTEADQVAKEAIVRDLLTGIRPGLVWDLGANTGEFSRLAAGHAGYVVAMDSDVSSVERLYRELKGEASKAILPLVVDLSDPSPGLGWQCRERQPLWDRGRPDVTLALALVHHLAIASNVPTAELIAWFAGLGGRLIVEYVEKRDPMVRRLLANKEDQYADYEQPAFEACLERHFIVEQRVALPRGTRFLYVCSSRQSSPSRP
jgi:hypothetical protein